MEEEKRARGSVRAMTALGMGWRWRRRRRGGATSKGMVSRIDRRGVPVPDDDGDDDDDGGGGGGPPWRWPPPPPPPLPRPPHVAARTRPCCQSCAIAPSPPHSSLHPCRPPFATHRYRVRRSPGCRTLTNMYARARARAPPCVCVRALVYTRTRRRAFEGKRDGDGRDPLEIGYNIFPRVDTLLQRTAIDDVRGGGHQRRTLPLPAPRRRPP